MSQKVLFIDRDGTLIVEPPEDFQVDSLEKLQLYPAALDNMAQIVKDLDFKLVMVTNQDGLGTDAFPEETFWPAHNKMLEWFEQVGVTFDEILIDRSFESDNAPTRKPRTGMLTHYLEGDYDLEHSVVIGDRLTDVQLAKNLGCKAVWLGHEGTVQELGELSEAGLSDTVICVTKHWLEIYNALSEI